MFRQHHSKSTDRKGTTVVETAFVLPVFLFFVLALIEFGHAQMVNNTLRSACRAGARLGSTEGRTSAEVKQHVKSILGSAIDVNAVHVFVKDGQDFDDGGSVPESGEGFESKPNLELDGAEPRKLFFIRAKVAYNDIALVPMPFMDGVTLQGQAFMRHE